MMNKIFKLSLLSLILLFLISACYATDNSTTTMEEQTIKETNINEDNMELPIDNTYYEKSNNINGNSQKNIKLEDETVTEYVNITKNNLKNYFNVFGGSIYMGKGITSSNNNLVLNLQYLPDNINFIGLDENNNKFTNRTLTITSDRNLALNNVEVEISCNFKELTFENINITYKDYRNNEYFTIADNVQHCILRNVTLDMDVDNVGSGYLIDIVGRTTIENSYIKGKFVETYVEWLTGPKTPDAYGIRIYSRDCVLRNNTIDISSSGSSVDYSTLYAIYVMNSNTTLTNNTIILRNGTGYLYGIVVRSSNNTISYNNITVSSISYANAVNLEMVMFQNNTVNNNYINVTASYGNAPWGNAGVAYGLEMLDFNYNGGGYTSGGRHPQNNSFINNTIVGSAGQIYGIEIYGTGDTKLCGNIINITGRTPMGIGFIGSDINVSDNIIINNGEHNRSEGTADYLEAINSGIYTLYTSININIINNTITSTNGRGILLKNSINSTITNNTINVINYTYAIEAERDEHRIENNTLITPKHTGDRAVKCNKNNTVQNNIPVEIPQYSLTIESTEFTIGSTNNITANIYYGDEIASNLSKGKVSFKVNGKTLKDTNGKVIYAKVVNGIATIENYTIPDIWAKENSTIQAFFSGSTGVSKLSSDKEFINITKDELTITTQEVQASAGQNVVLTASINNAGITNAKVVFKINGKTVKDANGKVIYAKIVNGQVSVEYTIPEDMNVKVYNLTAVLLSSEYGRIEDTKVFTVI